jgi:transposase
MENDMRGLLRNFGLKVGTIGAFKFDQRIRELVEAAPDLTEIIEPLLAARQKLRQEFAKLDRKVRGEARIDPVCRQLIRCPESDRLSRSPIPRQSTFRPAFAIRERWELYWG